MIAGRRGAVVRSPTHESNELLAGEVRRIGQRLDDLEPFDANEYVERLFEE